MTPSSTVDPNKVTHYSSAIRAKYPFGTTNIIAFRNRVPDTNRLCDASDAPEGARPPRAGGSVLGRPRHAAGSRGPVHPLPHATGSSSSSHRCIVVLSVRG